MSDKPFVYGPNNPHPLSQMRTELVWDGKYDEYGRRREVNVAELAMPMQLIETVDEPRSRAEAEGQLRLWEKKTNKAREKEAEYDACRNRLIWGDNKLVMASLLKEFKGKIDLIYIDPPFDVGVDFTMDVCPSATARKLSARISPRWRWSPTATCGAKARTHTCT